MRQLEERILIRELGKLAGFFGGFGARLAARRLPVAEHAITVDVNSKVEDIRSAVLHILQGIGKVTDEFASHNPDGGISAIVGSGHMNLNPTIVHVRLSKSAQFTTKVSIRAVAKEGIVKQHSAAKVVERIRGMLLDRDA